MDALSVHAELVAGIKSLPHAEAQVLHLYYVEALSWETMSIVLCRPAADLKILYWRAVHRLVPSLEHLP